MNKMFSMKSSLAKLFVLTSALGFVAGCTDYLNDFEEKYDDGNAFTLPSGNNGDDNGTSNAEDVKSSSSNGSTANATSSAGKTESSGSNDSSSSNGSSSSSSLPDAESTDSHFKSETVDACNIGTVIYDEDYSDMLKIGDLFDKDNIEEGSYLKKNNFSLDSKTLRMFLDDNDDHSVRYDLSGWGGLCIEYTSTTHMGIHFYSAPNALAINQGTAAVATFENSKNERVAKTIEWNNLEPKGVIDSTNIIDFYRYASENGSIKIHKITTINSSVKDLLIPTATESGSIRCTGSTIYDARYPDSLGLGFKYSYNNKIIDIDTISSKEGLTLPYTNGVTWGNFVLDKDFSLFDASSWGGLCIEYKPVHSAVMVNITGSDNEAIYKSLPRDSSFVELKWDATDWKNTQGETQKTFDFSHVNSIAIGVESKPTITRLTILKSGITSVEPISSSSSVECTGTVLFSKDKGINDAKETLHTVLNVNKAGTYFYSYLNYEGTPNEYFDVTPWQGLCIEYSSSMNFMVSLMRVSTLSNQEKAIEAEFKLTSTNNSVTTRQMYWGEIYNRKEPVYKAILTAANMLKVETYDSTGSATINKITAITSDAISKTKTFTAENSTLSQEWFIGAKNEFVSFDNASAQCSSGGLPTLEEIKALGTMLEGTKIASGDTADNTYPILVGDVALTDYQFALNGSTEDDSFALWTSDKYVVYFKKLSGESKKRIYWKQPTDYTTTKASVRCIKK